MNSSPAVDVTVAVHSATRPIARAVGSVITGTTAPVRVNVVAHNIDPAIIRANLGNLADNPAVRLLPLTDNIPSPAGPLNHGLDHSTAPFTSVMGSDDELAPGAIDAWLNIHTRTNAAAVIARINHIPRGNDSYPPVRPFRQHNLDPVKDRLAYRSAPLGLISRTTFGDLRFTAGLPSGEDLAYVTRIWFSGHPIAFARTAPAYIGHHDAIDRVSHEPRAFAEQFAFLDGIIDEEWFSQLTAREREAIVVKLIRVQVFDAVFAHLPIAPWATAERAPLADALARLRAASPTAERHLSLADHRLLAAAVTDTDAATLASLARARWKYASVGAMLTPRPQTFLSRQAPLRTFAAGIALQRLG